MKLRIRQENCMFSTHLCLQVHKLYIFTMKESQKLKTTSILGHHYFLNVDKVVVEKTAD